MYRKRFEPQLTHLPQNYCGWAAEGGAECTDLPAEACTENKPALPCPVKKECGCLGSELTDIILIGAIIAFLLFMKDDGKPDISLLLPLALLLFAK